MLHYQAYGDPHCPGAPVAIFHGMFGSSDNWRDIARAVAERRFVVAFDLPGHGASRGADGPVSFRYGDMAELVAESLAAAAAERGTAPDRPWLLVGHSMGAKLAMAMALRLPHAVSGLVAVDSAPIDYRGRGYNQDVLALLRELDLTAYADRLSVGRDMERWVADPTMRGFLLKNIESRDGALAWRFDAPAIAAGAADIADWPRDAGAGAPYAGPALFVAGELSDYIRPAEDAGRIRSLFPRAEIVVVPQARHWVHFDNKPDFLLHVSRFLLTMD